MRLYEKYICKKCSSRVQVISIADGSLSCCGEVMECETEDNLTPSMLNELFWAESMQYVKYNLFAEVADEEGFHVISKHFKKLADHEFYHARVLLKEMNKINSNKEMEDTKTNLEVAIYNEDYAHAIFYPMFVKYAEEEGHQGVADIINMIINIEVEHEKQFKKLYESMENNDFLKSEKDEKWICEVCGHVHVGKEAPEECPLCKTREFKIENLY